MLTIGIAIRQIQQIKIPVLTHPIPVPAQPISTLVLTQPTPVPAQPTLPLPLELAASLTIQIRDQEKIPETGTTTPKGLAMGTAYR
jgi:hypothetical protein